MSISCYLLLCNKLFQILGIEIILTGHIVLGQELKLVSKTYEWVSSFLWYWRWSHSDIQLQGPLAFFIQDSFTHIWVFHSYPLSGIVKPGPV